MNYNFNIFIGGNAMARMAQLQQQYGSLIAFSERFSQRTRSAFASASQSVEQLRRRLTFGREIQSVDALNRRLDGLTRRRDISVNMNEIRQLNREIQQAEREMRRLQQMGGGGDGNSGGLFSRASGLFPALGAAGLVAGVGSFAQAGMSAEQTKLAYSQFAGDQAGPLYERLNKFANDTSFSNDEILQGGRTLLAAGYNPDSIQPLMKTVGNISAGAGKNYGDMISAVAKIKQKGFVDGGELHQEFGGTPLMETLKKNLGVDGDTLFKMAEKHQIRYEDLEKAMIDMTTGKGIFTGYLDKDMATAKGKLSTFLGNFQYKIQQWAEKLNPLLGKLFDFGTALLDKIDPLLEKLAPVFETIVTGVSKVWDALSPLGDLFAEVMIFVGDLWTKFVGLSGGTDSLRIVFELLAAGVSIASYLLKWMGELVMWLIEGPLGTLVLVIAGLTGVWWALNAAIALNPLTIWISVLAAVAVGLKWAWDNVDGFRYAIIRCVNVLKAMMSAVGPILQALVMPTPANIAAAYQAAKSSFTDGLKAADRAIATDKAARAAGKVSKVPTVAGQNKPAMPTAPGSGKPGGKDGIGKASGLDATTGGTKSTTITINLKSLVERLNINAGSVGEGVKDMEAQVTDAMLRVLNSANSMSTQ